MLAWFGGRYGLKPLYFVPCRCLEFFCFFLYGALCPRSCWGSCAIEMSIIIIIIIMIIMMIIIIIIIIITARAVNQSPLYGVDEDNTDVNNGPLFHLVRILVNYIQKQVNSDPWSNIGVLVRDPGATLDWSAVDDVRTKICGPRPHDGN